MRALDVTLPPPSDPLPLHYLVAARDPAHQATHYWLCEQADDVAHALEQWYDERSPFEPALEPTAVYQLLPVWRP